MANHIDLKNSKSFEEINAILKENVEKSKKGDLFSLITSDDTKFNKFGEQINFKIFPFNFYLFEEDKNHLIMDKEQLILNLKNYNKLYIKNNDGNRIKQYIMYQFFEEFTQLIGNFDIEFIHQESLNKYFLEKYGILPTSILFFWDFSTKIAEKIRKDLPSTKIVLWTDDIHWFDEKRKIENRDNYISCDKLIAHYNLFDCFYKIDVSNKLWLSHHCCSSHFSKGIVSENSIKKIFYYGADNPNHYPLRVWFKNAMLKDYPNLIEIKKHPGYVSNGFESSLETARELYNYSFCFTSGAFPKFEIEEPENAKYYLIGKIFEICGSGVLLLCHNKGIEEELKLLGFENNEHYININESNFHDIIYWLFDKKNIQEISRIRNNGHKLINNFHLTKHRCRKLNTNFSLI